MPRDLAVQQHGKALLSSQVKGRSPRAAVEIRQTRRSPYTLHYAIMSVYLYQMIGNRHRRSDCKDPGRSPCVHP